MRPIFLLTLPLLFMSTNIRADVVALANGDSINGSLVSRDAINLVWKSELLGELKIPVAQVQSLNGQPLEPYVAKVEEKLPFDNQYAGSLSFTGAFASGNKEREDWDLETGVGWRSSEQLRHEANIDYESHSENGDPADEKYDLGYNIDKFFNEKWYWSNGFNWGADEEREIDQYYSIGSGLGHQFWESKHKALSAESGLLWVNEEFEDGSENEALNVSWKLNYKTLVLERYQLVHNHRLLVSVEDTKDSEFRADLALRAPVIENLFAEMKIEWIYDNQPAEDADRTDTQVTFGVNYDW